MGLQVKEFRIQQAVCSLQCRSKETLDEMLRAMGDESVPVLRSAAINERDYGDFTGKNKLAMKELMGAEEFEHMHRQYTYPIPHGESLQMVYERAVPFYREVIVPMLVEGKSVLMVSHGNTIRSIMKYIERIPDDDIKDVEMLFGNILIYRVDKDGHLVSRDERFTEPYESGH
jgi:2,3-bisphosphoglycerate-dependent phosphoglycerate mutase